MFNFLVLNSMILANPLTFTELPCNLQCNQEKNICLISCANSICQEVLTDLLSVGYEVGLVSCTFPADQKQDVIWSMYFYKKGGACALSLPMAEDGPTAPEEYEPVGLKGANGPKGPCHYLIN